MPDNVVVAGPKEPTEFIRVEDNDADIKAEEN
jgi:hypothetical protein